MARASVWGLLVGELVQAVPAAVEVVVSEVSPIQLVCERDEHVSAATGIDTQGSRRTTEWERAVMTERGERLPGGNLGGAWRVGDTVRRETGPWSPAVHALLEHLHGRLDGVPCFHGLDEHGREVLDFLPGRIVDVDTEELTDQQLVAVVAWARRLHEAVAGFEHPGPWRGFPPAEATLIGHGDIAPYNVCFDDDTLVGVFDWDMAGPTSVDHELGFIAWNCVPLCRPMPDPWCAARLRLIATTYG